MFALSPKFAYISFPKKIIMSEDSINGTTKVIGEILSTKFEEIKNIAIGNTCDSGLIYVLRLYDFMKLNFYFLC